MTGEPGFISIYLGRLLMEGKPFRDCYPRLKWGYVEEHSQDEG